MWRLVRAGMATFTEIETSWNFDDVLRGAAVLDYEDDLSYIASKRRGKGK